jgi:hypothetical protein
MPEGVIAGVVEVCFKIMFRFLQKKCKILLEFSTMIANSLAKVDDLLFGCLIIFFQLQRLFSLACDRKMAVRIGN